VYVCMSIGVFVYMCVYVNGVYVYRICVCVCVSLCACVTPCVCVVCVPMTNSVRLACSEMAQRHAAEK